MPTLDLNGTRYAYGVEGSGPLIVFGHGLLHSREMFRTQIDSLRDRYRCVAVDWPGHGESGWREDGWTFWELAEDAAALVRALGEERAVFAGLSQGGFAFIRLALAHPEIVRGLVLLDTSAEAEEPDRIEGYQEVAEELLHGSDQMRRNVCTFVSTILYGPTWRAAHPEALEREIAVMLSHPREGIARAVHAHTMRDDVADRLGEIATPTLVVCGEEDTALIPEHSRTLADGIPGAELVMIPRAGHHSPIENPRAVTEAIEGFLARLEAT